jgi:hypothetical protein
MDVEFAYTREDWVEIDARHYRDWLFSRRPLAGPEYGICWFFLLLSVVGGVGLLSFLGAAVWLGLAWYFVVGAAALLLFDCGMALEVLRPRRAPVRGLIHELIFRMNWQDRLLAKVKSRRAAHFRRLDEKGELVLTHCYRLRLDPDGLTLSTEYPAVAGAATHQEDRMDWGVVCAIEQDDHFLSFTLEGRRLFVPRTAFADEDAYGRFARAAEAYHAAPAPANTRFRAAGEGPRGARSGSF